MSKRSKLLRKRGGKGRLGVPKLVKKFKVGDVVAIDLKPDQSGMPHPRYRGRHGVVVGKRGKAYVVKLKFMSAVKELVVPAVHLEKA